MYVVFDEKVIYQYQNKTGGVTMYYIFSYKLQSYLMYHNEPLAFGTAGAAHRFLRDHLHTGLRKVTPCIVVKIGKEKENER